MTPRRWTAHVTARPVLGAALALVTVLTACSGDDDDDDAVVDEGTSVQGTVADPDPAPGGTVISPPPTTAPTSSTSEETADTGATTTPPPTSPAPPLAEVAVVLTEVAAVPAPVAATTRPGEQALYVADQEGRVFVIGAAGRVEEPVLDIRDEVRAGGEQGLLGIAFSPDGAWLYAHYSDDPDGDTVVAAFPFADGVADPAGETVILTVDQPYENHNGGELTFGPDGMLYLALGDGGSSGDPEGNGQSLETLLGKILRIDPRPGQDPPYVVPDDNPFVGVDGALPEIWAYGLRNPWRFSFDAATGDVWIGDVGQDAWEEVSFGAAGDSGWNFGWNRLEGTHEYEGDPPPDAVAPVLEYPRDDGFCSVVGGFVYRGTRIPALAGAYLYSDYCAGTINAARLVDGAIVDQVALPIAGGDVTSFAQDPGGELYVLGHQGVVFRIDPA
jgi:glucose/arabinose dehydrogenase